RRSPRRPPGFRRSPRGACGSRRGPARDRRPAAAAWYARRSSDLSEDALGRQRHPGTNLGPSGRGGRQLERAAEQSAALLPPEQPEAKPASRAVACAGHVESLAVVAHHQLERAILASDRDPRATRVRVARDVGKRLLGDAEAG